MGAKQMKSNLEGFMYPVIDNKKCRKCKICNAICVFKSGYENDLNLHKIDVYAVAHKDNDILMTSSSGGVFTAISDYVLDKGGAIYGAGFDENFNVLHKKAQNKEERDELKGSKYVQSDLGTIFLDLKKELLNDRYVMFIGTPCQTAGLYSYLGENKLHEKLIVCDVLCHGTPSPLIWKEYLNFLKRHHKRQITALEFRSKALGWQMNCERAVTYKIKGKKDIYKESNYYYLFFNHDTLRPSCHNCKFTNLNRPSDITIGDFWGIEKHKPRFDCKNGVSLVLINSEKGKALFKTIKDKLIYEESSIDECIQPSLKAPTPKSKNREQFWEDYYNKGFKYVFKKYTPYGKNGIKNSAKRVIKRILKKSL